MGIDALSSTNTNFIEGEKYFLETRGKENNDISENFQYHDDQIILKKIKLTNSDKFFRQGFAPMHLMDFQFFNNLVDDFLEWC